LRPTNLHWIKGETDDPYDLCAHSGVEFCIGDEILVSQSDGEWTVSAAALYLLRTLTLPHTKDKPIGEHLFPCCGFTMWDIKGQDDVVICGCPKGANFEVVRVSDEIVLTGPCGRKYGIGFLEWRDAVCGFSDVVQSFYAASSPKQPYDEEDAKGFKKFMAEWSRRRSMGATLA